MKQNKQVTPQEKLDFIAMVRAEAPHVVVEAGERVRQSVLTAQPHELLTPLLDHLYQQCHDRYWTLHYEGIREDLLMIAVSPLIFREKDLLDLVEPHPNNQLLTLWQLRHKYFAEKYPKLAEIAEKHAKDIPLFDTSWCHENGVYHRLVLAMALMNVTYKISELYTRS